MYTIIPISKAFESLSLLFIDMCNSHLKCLVVMVNFTCQLDWAICPDIWLKITLGVSVRVFLDKIHIYTSRLSESGCCPPCRGASSNPLKA